MQGNIEAIVHNSPHILYGEITNVSGIIGERFIKLFPRLAKVDQPYIVNGTSYDDQDRFIGISFSCFKEGFVAWFASGFKEVTLSKKDRVHIYFESGASMSLHMLTGKCRVNSYDNTNLANLSPIQMAYFCDNHISHIIAESGSTGVMVKVEFMAAKNNPQYTDRALGSKMVLQAARTITVTQQNLNRLS